MSKTDEEVLDMMFGKDRPKYLGETPVNIDDHPLYSGYQPKDWALLWIEKYGQVEGSSTKTWVLDQVARILNGTKVTATLKKWDNGDAEMSFTLATPPLAYEQWVLMMLGAKDDDGEYEYEYDDGTRQ